MRKIYLLLVILVLSLLMTACAEAGDAIIGSEDAIKDGDIIIQEVTLYPEDKIFEQSEASYYAFNGFLSDETLSFQTDLNLINYQPAVKGTEFQMKYLNLKAEIIDFDREKGFVTLKIQTLPDEEQ